MNSKPIGFAMNAELTPSTGHDYPIPGKLNLIIATLQLLALLALLWASGHVSFGWGLLAVALGYGLVMNSAYAMLHEAELRSLPHAATCGPRVVCPRTNP
jgi:hypothetical protein